jgi:chromosomal replication initiation ATPase DnaA
MKILNRLDEIIGLIAKSSISDEDYKKIHERIKAIKDEFDLTKNTIKKDNIKDTIAKYFKIDPSFYLDRCQDSDLVLHRQITMSFLYKYSTQNKSEIAKYFNQGHANIIHGIKTIQNLCDTDRKILNIYNEIDYIITIKYTDK